MSFRLMSTSSTDEPAMISNDGNDFSRTSISTTRASRRPARSCSRKRSRVWFCWSRAAAGSSSGAIGRVGGSSRSSSRSSAFCAALPAHLLEPLLADHVDAELDEIADHRLDVAADVADLGELRRLDLDERRLREPRQPARDLGLADAGRPDHQDVLRRDLLGQLRRQLLPAHAVAQRDRDGALGGRLADDVLVELGDDLARRQRLGRGLRGFGQVDRHVTALRRRCSRSCRCRSRRRSPSTFSAIVRASRSVLRASALAAASAYGPPDPIATMPSSGSMRSPLPDSRNVGVLVEHDEHRLEPAQDAVAAPVLGELDRRALEIAAILLELGLEAREEREGIGGRAGKAGQDAIVVEPPDLPRALLDDRLAEGHLAIARQHRAVAVADRKNRRAVNHHGF